MPQIQLSEKCSRCPRVEYVEVSLDEAIARVKAPTPKAKALEVVVDGEKVLSYEHLCEECRGIVVGYAEGMKKQTKKASRRFKRVTAEHAAQETRRQARGPRAVP